MNWNDALTAVNSADTLLGLAFVLYLGWRLCGRLRAYGSLGYHRRGAIETPREEAAITMTEWSGACVNPNGDMISTA